MCLSLESDSFALASFICPGRSIGDDDDLNRIPDRDVSNDRTPAAEGFVTRMSSEDEDWPWAQ
jgi:hypothetical protein